MMPYFFSVPGGQGEVYSCDKIILSYRLPCGGGQRVLDYVASRLLLQYDHWTSRKAGSYLDQFSVKVDSGSWWLGVGLAGFGRPNTRTARLEYNPNKVGAEPELQRMARFLATLAARVDVKQFDLAVDWPIERTRLVMVKDARMYEEVRHSDADRTQYVGQRNAPGRCKLYNKQLERKLDYPLSRVELTVGMDACSPQGVAALWPVIYCTDPVQLRLCGDLNDTDQFILRTLIDAPERIMELSRRKRDKLRPVLEQVRRPLPFDLAAYQAVLDWVVQQTDPTFDYWTETPDNWQHMTQM